MFKFSIFEIEFTPAGLILSQHMQIKWRASKVAHRGPEMVLMYYTRLLTGHLPAAPPPPPEHTTHIKRVTTREMHSSIPTRAHHYCARERERGCVGKWSAVLTVKGRRTTPLQQMHPPPPPPKKRVLMSLIACSDRSCAPLHPPLSMIWTHGFSQISWIIFEVAAFH